MNENFTTIQQDAKARGGIVDNVMRARLKIDRSFIVVLAAVMFLHALALLIPVAWRTLPDLPSAAVVQLRLQQPAAEPEPEPSAASEIPFPAAPVPVELAELPPPQPGPAKPEPVAEPIAQSQAPVITATRIIDELAAPRRNNALRSFEDMRPRERPSYFARYRPVLEEVLNAPVVQLPFEDTRIYVVDSYDNGFLGGMERFWDNVTVPFGFTTKNNTRFQCAWVMILAGCSWGHASMYYAADKAKRRQ